MTQSEKNSVGAAQKRAVSPPKNDDSFLQNLLGTKKPETEKLKISQNPPIFDFDDSKSGKNGELLLSDDEDTLNIISKKPVRMAKAAPKPISEPVLPSVPEKPATQPVSTTPVTLHTQPTQNMEQQILNLTSQLQAQNVSNFQNSQNDQLRSKMNELESKMIDESKRFSSHLKELEIDNQSHINRLKKTHQESIQLLKDEKDGQIQRIKVCSIENFTIVWVYKVLSF